MSAPLPPRLAAFHANGADRYGVVTADGIIDLLPEFGHRFKGLKEVIEAGAIDELLNAAEGRRPSYREEDVTYLIPIANPEKLICVGVNFPSRNEEYKDGRPPPASLPCSFASRAVLSATAKTWYAPPKASSSTTKVK